MSSPIFEPDWEGSWTWGDHQVSYIHAPAIETGSTSAVLLIHGFGACKEHWRHNVEALRAKTDVYAIDLVGFGKSSKPPSHLIDEPRGPGAIFYSIDLWAEQVEAFISAIVGKPVTLIGNSIGGVVALAAALRLETHQKPVKRVVLVDCAQRAIDEKRLAEQPPLRRWGRPLLKALVKQRWLTTPLFQSLIKPGIIQRVLKAAYPSGNNIDDELVQLLLKPALEPGASESFRGFINLFNDQIAPDLLKDLRTPVEMIWGRNDPWEPIEEARRWCNFDCVERLDELEDLGHCPHDEAPERVNPLLISALSRSAEPT
jgi:pimeloyl-ACP methyl ester carboxylesterase